jgi:hypothetical protein
MCPDQQSFLGEKKIWWNFLLGVNVPPRQIALYGHEVFWGRKWQWCFGKEENESGWEKQNKRSESLVCGVTCLHKWSAPRYSLSLSVCMCLLQHGLTLSRVRTTDTCKKPRVIKQLSISKEKKCRVSWKKLPYYPPTLSKQII